jgi:hypothetical protein
MEHYAGIDVSLESANLCVVDATGRIVREAKVASEPDVLIGWFRGLEFAVTRIGLEACVRCVICHSPRSGVLPSNEVVGIVEGDWHSTLVDDFLIEAGEPDGENDRSIDKHFLGYARVFPDMLDHTRLHECACPTLPRRRLAADAPACVL